MLKLTRISSLAIATMVFGVAACMQMRGSDHAELKSDWEGSADSQHYAIDWPCQPKEFSDTAKYDPENDDSLQQEYCEWTSKKLSETQKLCTFTVSFDDTRPFYLNVRRQTEMNSIGAAQALIKACQETALARLRQGLPEGTLCNDISEGCVKARNSDPEICDRVRFMTAQHYAKHLNFTVDEMPTDDVEWSKQPLMRFGLLKALPRHCEFAKNAAGQADQTQVSCTIAAADTCYSLTDKLRVGVRIITAPFAEDVAPVANGAGSAAQPAQFSTDGKATPPNLEPAAVSGSI